MRPPCGRRIPRSRGSGCYARAGRCCGLPCAEWYCGPLVQSVQACGVRIGEDLQDFLLQEISLGTLSAYIAHTCFTPLPEDGRTCIGFISAEELYTLLEWKISHWLLSLRICIPLAYRASSADVRNFFVGIEEGDGTKNSARITLLEREITQLPEFQGWEQPVCRLFHGVLFVVHISVSMKISPANAAFSLTVKLTPLREISWNIGRILFCTQRFRDTKYGFPPSVRSGCGMSATTFPAGLQIPAMAKADPLGVVTGSSETLPFASQYEKAIWSFFRSSSMRPGSFVMKRPSPCAIGSVITPSQSEVAQRFLAHVGMMKIHSFRNPTASPSTTLRARHIWS